MSAQHGLDLAQHRRGAAGVGDRQVGPGKLQAGLDGQGRQRVGEPGPQALRPGEELVRTLDFPAVECDAGRQRADECAGGVLVHPRTAGDRQRSLGELLGLDPSPSSDRERGALGERHHRQLVRSQLEALLDSVGEQVVGLVDLAGQPLRQREYQHGIRAEEAPTGERSERELRICAHPRHPPVTTLATQHGQPGVDRRAAVRQGAVVARVFGRLGPTVRLLRPAPHRGEDRAEDGEHSVPVECPVRFQPVEPALGRRRATALVGEDTEKLDQPCHPVDVAGLLGVADGRLRLPVRLTPFGCACEQPGYEVRLG